MKLRDLLEVFHPDMEIVVIQGNYEVKNTADEALAFLSLRCFKCKCNRS